jgi:hypothetical protein
LVFRYQSILAENRGVIGVVSFSKYLEKAHLYVSLSEKRCALPRAERQWLRQEQQQRQKDNGMASYHLSAKIGPKGKATAHAAYISREGKYSGSDRYEDLESKGSGNMPKWAEQNAAHFWNAADEHERANGSAYREIEVALPRELTPDQRRELVEDFVRQELGDQHAYQWAIHTPKAALEGGDQPHAHIMYSERRMDGIERDPSQLFKRYNAKNPERGGAQKASGGKARGEMKDELLLTRQRWADVQNAHLERYGHAARVDHRSLAEQGIERAPEKHLGGAGVRALADQDISALLERRAAEGEHERAQRSVSSLIDLSGDLSAAKAERTRQQDAARQVEQAKQQLTSGAADFRAKFMAERAAKIEADRRAELAREAAAFRQAEAMRKAELEKIAQEQQREGRSGPKKDGPGFSR